MTMRADQCSTRSIAKRLCRSASTISRELNRTSGTSVYDADLAHWRSLAAAGDRLAELFKSRSCLHADETPVRQLDPGSGKTHQTFLLTYRSNALDPGPSMVVLDYQTSRAGAHPHAFLKK